MLDSLDSWPPAAVAALVAAIVSLATSILVHPLRYVVDRALYRGKIRAEYRHEQLKEMKETVGRNLGLLLEASSKFDNRMRNIYKNKSINRTWLDASGCYDENNYYLDTTVHRFLMVFTAVRQFELRAIYIDRRIVKRSDFQFVALCHSIQWTMTDVALFDGLGYDPVEPVDHFFSDQLRTLADWATTCGPQPTISRLKGTVNDMSSPEWAVWKFFDGLRPNEQDRLRWDRLVCLHLALMLFLSRFGYKMHQPKRSQFRDTLSQIENEFIRRNLITWLIRLGVKRSLTWKLRY